MGYKWKQQKSLVSDNMLWQYIGDREGLVYNREHAIWILLHQEGFSVVLKGKSWLLLVAHQPDRHRSVPQALLTVHSRTDKVETNIFLYIIPWILLLSGFWQESSAKARTAVEGQKGILIGAVYRKYLNISKCLNTRTVMTVLISDSNAEDTDQHDGGFLKKGQHFPGISAWYALFPILGKKKHTRDS